MDIVPIEILHCILDYVAPMCEADSQAACLRVCKLWYDVVKRVAKPMHDRITQIATWSACINKHDQLLCWLIYSGYGISQTSALGVLRIGNMRLVRCLAKYCAEQIGAMLCGDNIMAMCGPKVVKYLVGKLNYQSHAAAMLTTTVVTRNFPVAEMLLEHYDPDGTLSARVCLLAVACHKSSTLDWALSRQYPCNVQDIIDQTRWISQRKRIKMLHVLDRYYPTDPLVKEALNAVGMFEGRIGSAYTGAYVLPPVPSRIESMYQNATWFRAIYRPHTNFAVEPTHTNKHMGTRTNKPIGRTHVMAAHIAPSLRTVHTRNMRKESSKHNSRRANSKQGLRRGH